MLPEDIVTARRVEKMFRDLEAAGFNFRVTNCEHHSTGMVIIALEAAPGAYLNIRAHSWFRTVTFQMGRRSCSWDRSTHTEFAVADQTWRLDEAVTRVVVDTLTRYAIEWRRSKRGRRQARAALAAAVRAANETRGESAASSPESEA